MQTVSITRALRIAATNYEKSLVRKYGTRYMFRARLSELSRLRILLNAVTERQSFVARTYAIGAMMDS